MVHVVCIDLLADIMSVFDHQLFPHELSSASRLIAPVAVTSNCDCGSVALMPVARRRTHQYRT